MKKIIFIIMEKVLLFFNLIYSFSSHIDGSYPRIPFKVFKTQFFNDNIFYYIYFLSAKFLRP